MSIQNKFFLLYRVALGSKEFVGRIGVLCTRLRLLSKVVPYPPDKYAGDDRTLPPYFTKTPVGLVFVNCCEENSISLLVPLHSTRVRLSPRVDRWSFVSKLLSHTQIIYNLGQKIL